MDEKHLYIEQSVVDDSLSVRLQRNTLKELQSLSGKRWTDFNAHDSGVTTANIANYVLTEVAYKLGFDLVDYLIPGQIPFVPDSYGMYLPENVYPTNPVTTKDYRTLFLSCIPDLDNVVVGLDEQSRYTIKYMLSPFAQSEPKEIESKIAAIFQANRNLCESLGSIISHESTYLYFHSEFELMPGMVAENILAQVYCDILAYLNGNIHFGSFEKFPGDESSWEEWLDGPKCSRRIIIPVQKDNMKELHGILSKIDGIKSFKTCYLSGSKDGLTDILSEFKGVYRLDIPKTTRDLRVKIRMGDNEIKNIDVETFGKRLEALMLLNHSSNSRIDKSAPAEYSRKHIPEGKFRDVFAHLAVATDFPVCFKVDTKYSSASGVKGNQTINRQFGAYLSLFDFVIQRGLNELKEVKNLLSIEDTDVTVLSKVNVFPGEGIALNDTDRFRDVFMIKNQYLDLLDHFYGVESNPKWISEFYEETEDMALKRRLKFLGKVPYLTQARSKACNLSDKCSIENVSTLKVHLSLLFGMAMNENVRVTNNPSGVLFTLIDKKRMDEQLLKALRIESVDEDSSNLSDWEVVGQDTSLTPQEEIQEQFVNLLNELKARASGIIWDTLFWEGIHIENYHILPAGKEFVLIFWNKINKIKQTITQSGSKDDLKKIANLLRNALLEQNRESEVVYVVENHLFVSSEQSVSVVLSNWSARFASPHFQEACRRLIRLLLPAHIKVSVYWLGQDKMTLFETAYHEWIVDWEKRISSEKLSEFQEKLKKIFLSE